MVGNNGRQPQIGVFEALTITRTDQGAISCIKLKGGVHVWTPGGPLTEQTHTKHTHGHVSQTSNIDLHSPPGGFQFSF